MIHFVCCAFTGGGQLELALAFVRTEEAMAAAAAATMKGVAMAHPGLLPTPNTHTRQGLVSSFLPPLRLCSSRVSSRGASIPSFCNSAQVSSCRPLHISASAGQAAMPAEPPKTAAHIWLSDVVPLWQKPCFKHRKWSGTDVGIATYMVIIHSLCLFAPFTFTWQAFGVFVLCYFITGMLGITLSYHRNLSHKSFTLPKWLEYTFAYCGALAMQGDPIEWVSSHRYHHQHCDTDKDPHSPYEGFWYSHMGWLLDNNSTLERVGARGNVGDMAKDPFYKFLQKTYAIHPILSAICLYAWGGVPFLVWGLAVRAVWVYHITWLVNSAAHVWGSQAWKTGDLSKNNWWVALLAFGEGWHNNHHAFEYSARHGLEWWQLDPTWYFIVALQKLGLATKVKLPTQEHMNRLALDAS